MRFQKTIQLTFVLLFFGCILACFAKSDFEGGSVSDSENRRLASAPRAFGNIKDLDLNLMSEFDGWINDNIGFRENMIRTDAKLRYQVFQIVETRDWYSISLGPNGEYNLLSDKWHHLDLFDEEELQKIVDAYQYVDEVLQDKGVQVYFMECWDKHSIYPEQYPKYANQYGDLSSTEQVENALAEETDLKMVRIKEALENGKENWETYSRFGDCTHWTQRGAYLGYLELMNTINRYNDNRYKVLNEHDYNITETDQGSYLFGGMHIPNMLENFEIKNPLAKAEVIDLGLKEIPKGVTCYTNEQAENDTVLLIMGDSYINSFILDDIAESFFKVYLVWNDYDPYVADMVELFDPDIVLLENAERCTRYYEIINAKAFLDGTTENPL